MKHTNKLFLIMASMIMMVSTMISNDVFGQKATFSNCALELNLKDDNGKTYFKYNFTAEITGINKHDIDMTLIVECPKGEMHTYTIEGDYGGDGLIRYPVYKDKSFKNKNKTDSCSLKNKFIWMYNSDVHPKKGKNTYYVYIEAKDAQTGKNIGKSDYLSFTMTGK